MAGVVLYRVATRDSCKSLEDELVLAAEVAAGRAT